MKITKEIEIYRIMVMLAAFSYIALYMRLGWQVNIHNEEMFRLLSYDGFGIIIKLPEYVYVAVNLAWLLALVGMFFFIKATRYLFILLTLFSTGMSIFWGIRVTSPVNSLNVEVLNLLIGGVLVFSYLGSVGMRFNNES